MNGLLAREFRLSPAGSGRGLSCSDTGAFIGPVPLLNRTTRGGIESWEPRDSEELSRELNKQYCLPIDMSSKIKGLHAVADALNSGDTARAQLTALFLQIPELPHLPEATYHGNELTVLTRALNASGLLAKAWDPLKHPRWPAHAPNCQGGQFAPKDCGASQDVANSRFGATPSKLRSNQHPSRDGFIRENYEPIGGSPIAITPELAVPELEIEAEAGLTELEARLEAELSARFGLKPGPYAKESIPASGPGITRSEQETINEIGSRDGCHTCGT